MQLEPKTSDNPSGLLPELLHHILEYLNTSDLMNLIKAGSKDINNIVEESMVRREKECKYCLHV